MQGSMSLQHHYPYSVSSWRGYQSQERGMTNKRIVNCEIVSTKIGVYDRGRQ